MMSSSLYRRLHGIFTNTNTFLPSTPTRLLSTRSESYVPSTRTYQPLTPQAQHQKKAEPNPRSLVDDLFKERDLRRVVDKFKEASQNHWFRNHHVVYFATARRLAAAKQFSWIEEILEEQKKFPPITDECFVNRLISMYGKSGMFDHAQKLFDEMPQLNCKRTVKSFNALLAACLHSGKFDKIEEIFRGVPRKLSIDPDVVSYSTVIKAFREMGSLDSMLPLVDEMENIGLTPDCFTFNPILDGFYQNGRFSDGEKVWKLMKNKGVAPSIWGYNAQLRGLVSQNRMSEAVELFEALGTAGLRPDAYTFNALIKGFCNGKDLEEAKEWYVELARKGCAPNRMTFRILVPFVFEMGNFEWGLKLCKEAATHRCALDAVTLQGVVDRFVKLSMVEEAMSLVEFIHQSDGYSRCELNLPLDEY